MRGPAGTNLGGASRAGAPRGLHAPGVPVRVFLPGRAGELCLGAPGLPAPAGWGTSLLLGGGGSAWVRLEGLLPP